MLFEAGKVVLHGRLPKLEAELLGMIAGGDYEDPGTSHQNKATTVFLFCSRKGKNRQWPTNQTSM